MLRQVFKYPVAVDGVSRVSVPKGAKTLHVGLDASGVPCVWAEVDPDAERAEAEVHVVGTGRAFDPAKLRYVGSVVGHMGVYAWHVYVPKGGPWA